MHQVRAYIILAGRPVAVAFGDIWGNWEGKHARFAQEEDAPNGTVFVKPQLRPLLNPEYASKRRVETN